MSGRISRQLSSENLTNLISHLEGGSSAGIDAELRAQFDNLLGRNESIASGTYTLESFSGNRASFKISDQYYYVDWSSLARGTDFNFLDANNDIVSAGNETDLGDGETLSTYNFYGTDNTSNPSNIKSINFPNSITAKTWLGSSNLDKFSKGYSAITSVTSSTTNTYYSNNSETYDEYILDLDESHSFFVYKKYNGSSSNADSIHFTVKNFLNHFDITKEGVLKIKILIARQSTSDTNAINFGNCRVETSYDGNSPVETIVEKSGSTWPSNGRLDSGNHINITFGSTDRVADITLNIARLSFNGGDPEFRSWFSMY
jgi:hypothetical protein